MDTCAEKPQAAGEKPQASSQKPEEVKAGGEAFPPPGWVDQYEAARLLGISDATLRHWLRKGQFGYAGELVLSPNGKRWRLFAVAELQRAHRAMKLAAGEETQGLEDARVWPPAGFVEKDEVARLCGVVPESLKAWVRQGKLPPGRLAKKPGGRAHIRVYPEQEVRRLAEEMRAAAAAPFPPPGFVDRYGAAAMFEMHTSQFILWQRLGRIRCPSKTVKGPGGGPAKIYAIADVERAKAQLAAEDAAAEKPPEGFLDRIGAAGFFGVTTHALEDWQREGRLSGTWVDLPGRRGRRRVYALAELERFAQQMRAEASRPTAPDGFIELHEAARRIGVHYHTFYQWEKSGQVTAGQVAPIPGTSARTKIYPVEEIERLREEIRKATENFPPPGWVEMKEAARRANVSVLVWKRWMAEGRVENWRWARRPTMARCKLFSIEEIDRIVAECGRDHHFFMEPDGQGGWRVPDGYLGRAEAAAFFGAAESTFVHWQGAGWVTCGRWARMPVGAGIGCGGRRAYPVEELRRMIEAFDKVSQPYADPQDARAVRVPIMSWGATPIEAIIDAADLPRIAGLRWHWVLSYGGGDGEAVRCAPPGEQVPFRRFLLGLEGPKWRINHRNKDSLDCRRANLIVRTQDEVIHGQRKRRKTHFGRPPTSRFKGVCWAEKRGKWLAHIQKAGVGRKLGAFDDEIAAAQAYDEAARELFGEHARLNFPDGVDAYLERAHRAAA